MRLLGRGLYNYLKHVYNDLYQLELKSGEEMLLQVIEEGAICYIFRTLNKCAGYEANELICVKCEDIEEEV